MQKHVHRNDKIKNELAKTYGYKLFRIWEDDISTEKIKEILKNVLI
jgi:very-short-patch-repair endonuclease